MLKRLSFVLCFFLFCFCCIVSADVSAPETSTATYKLRMAVLDFESIGKDAKENEWGMSVAENIRTELFKTGKYDVLERNVLMKLLEEQKLQSTGIVDTDTAVSIGKISGSEKMVAGSISKAGTTLTINVRFIDMKTGSIEKAEKLTGNNENDIPNMVDDIVKLLMGENIERGKYMKEGLDKKTEKKEHPVDIDLGVHGGIYYPLDKKVSDDYGVGFIWGVNGTFGVLTVLCGLNTSVSNVSWKDTKILVKK